MDENLLRQLFPWPADRPRRKPRFGTGSPPDPVALPDDPHEFGDTPTDRQPFSLELPLENLGLIVSLEERHREHAGELWVTVRSTSPAPLGKEVRVVLIGSEERTRRVPVTIDNTEEGKGCFGETRVGRIDEVRAGLGNEITLSAFLLD